MKNFILKSLLFSALTLSLPSCAQEPPKEQSKQIEFIEIPNSRVSFPVSNFKTEPNLIGLIKGEKAVIQVMEVMDDTYENQAKNMDPKSLEQRGGVIIDERDLTVANYTAKYLSAKSPDARKLTMLLFGDSTFCVMLSAVNNSVYDTETDKEIEYLLANVKFDRNKKIDPLFSAPFEIIGDSSFKHAGFSVGLHYFTKTGEFTKGEKVSPFVVINSGPMGDESELGPLFEYTIQSLEQYGSKIETPIKVEKTTLNGYPAYQETFEMESDGVKDLFYLLVLYSNNVYVIFQGKAENKSDLEEIKYFGNAIRFK